MSEYILELEGIGKAYGDIVAVDDIDLRLRDGEFFTLLGPSGSGKSTLLRMISGLETPDSGRILMHSEEITEQRASEQDTALIFQEFSLFPHKTVGENVAFPLKMQGVDAAERRSRAEETLGFVDLVGYYDRYPPQLSGGERQRVALARGIISEPELLLLDEPLSNLDRKLRKDLEVELRKYQRDTGITFVYVTHNQDEALTVSDRMAVMRDGNVEQLDEPAQVYSHPRTSFVGRFLGESNQLRGNATAVDGDVVAIENDGMVYSATAAKGNPPAVGENAEIQIKIEDCAITADPDTTADNTVPGTLSDRIFLGSERVFLIETETLAGVEEFVVKTPKEETVSATIGESVCVTWEPTDAWAFDVS